MSESQQNDLLESENLFPIQIPRFFTFFAIGDWGYPTEEVHQIAQFMDSRACTDPANAPAFILSLGDNFYPRGVESVLDPQFQTSWQNVFLIYKSLNVPWKVCLGNHDYSKNPLAQIEFTYHPLNPSGLWQCPSKNYSFTTQVLHPNLSDPASVEFFCLDTNGAQFSCRQKYKTIVEDLKGYIRELAEKLENSTARWKIVFAHHPLYTKSIKHGTIGKCLRNDRYRNRHGEEFEGFSLENVLAHGGVSAYISGHEHRFQHHQANGINYFVAGAGGCTNVLYGGPDPETQIDWVDNTKSNGFLEVNVSYEMLKFRFISNSGVLKEIEINKGF